METNKFYAKIVNGLIESYSYIGDETYNVEFTISTQDEYYLGETGGSIFKIVDGVAVMTKSIDEYRQAKALEEQKRTLREYRKIKCFPVVNRGKVWYDSLTSEQYNELMEWYNSWLNVTETMIMPLTPAWIT